MSFGSGKSSGNDDVWIVDGVSDAAIQWAETESARRALTLGEWIEEVIEHALVQEKSAAGGKAPDEIP